MLRRSSGHLTFFQYRIGAAQKISIQPCNKTVVSRLSLPLPKPVLIAAALISIVVAGGVGGTWEYVAYAVKNLKIVCNLPGGSVSNPADMLVTVGVKNPSLVSVDGTWKFVFEGNNGTTPWSSGDTVSFHIPSGGTSILNLTFPGLAGHIYGTHSALWVNVTFYAWVSSYHVAMWSFTSTGSATNATVEVPFTQGGWRYC
jgi:hypothetical protein